jgi:hypothetical protein
MTLSISGYGRSEPLNSNPRPWIRASADLTLTDIVLHEHTKLRCMFNRGWGRACPVFTRML